MFTFQVRGVNCLFVGDNEEATISTGQKGSLSAQWDETAHDVRCPVMVLCAATVEGLIACLHFLGLEVPRLPEKVHTDLASFMESAHTEPTFRAILADHWRRLMEGIEAGDGVSENWWQLHR